MVKFLKRWINGKSETSINRGQIESVLKISQKLLTSLYQFDRQRVWSSVTGQIRELYDCELVSLFLVDEANSDYLIMKAQSHSGSEEWTKITLKIESGPGKGITGHVAKTGTTVILNPGDMQTNPYIRNRNPTHLKSGTCYSALVVPLKNRKDKLVGVLGLNNKEIGKLPKRSCFSEADKASVELLAVEIVALLENAHAYDALRALISEIQSAGSTDKAVDCILSNAVGLLHASHAKLGLLSTDKTKLVYAGGKNLRGGLIPEKGDPIDPSNLMVALWNSAISRPNEERIETVENGDVWLNSGPLGNSDWTRCSPQAKSSISALIRAHNQAVGVLHLESHLANYFDELDQQLLKAFAQNVTVAIQSISKPWPSESAGDQNLLSLGEAGGLYRSVVDRIPLVMWRKDKDGRFTWVNPAFCKTIGKPESEILGESDSELFPTYAERYRRGDEIAMQEGSFEDDEELYQLPTGEESVIHVFKTAIHDHLGNVTGTQGVFLDVTGDKYRQLFRDAPIGFVELDQDGIISHVNEAAREMLGYKESEMLNKAFSEFSSDKPVLQEIVSKHLKRASGAEKSEESEEEELQPLVNLKKIDGTIAPVLIAARRVTNSEGEAIGLLCVVREIRAGIEIEEALREPDSRYLARIRELSIPVFRLDENLKVSFVNDAYLEHGNFKKADVLGKTTSQIHQQDIDLAKQYDEDNQTVLKRGIVLDQVELHPKKEGGRTIVRVLKFPVRNSDDQIIGVQAVFWKHENQPNAIKELSEALKQAKEEYRTIVQEAGEGIFQSETNGQIIAANRAMVRILGYESEEELLGNAEAGVERFAVADERAGYFRMLESTIPHGSHVIDYNLLTKDGEVIWVTESVQKVVDHHGRERFVGFVENISYRREAAEKRENMVTMLAHQLRSPAWVCFDRLDYWVHQLDPYGQQMVSNPSPELSKLATARGLARKTRHVAWSIDMMSKLAHSEVIDLGKRSPVPMNPRNLIKLAREAATDTELILKASAAFRGSMGKKATIPEFDISVNDSRESHRRLIGCADLIEQSVGCLIDNAFKYAQMGGTIKIHLLLQHDSAILSVKNKPMKGLKIDREASERCREKDWRSEGAKHCNADGSGLGLWLVDRIMDAHGGKLLVDITDIEGWNNFSLQFPLKANT